MTSILQQIKATRFGPPGRAGEDERRARIFSASLKQFETMFRSASKTALAARPLPLFYSLSQASRAIVAAFSPNQDGTVRGHGLSEGRIAEPIHHSSVKPARSPGLFDAMSELTGSELLTGTVEIGELWNALPIESPTSQGLAGLPALRAWPRSYSTDPLEHKLGSARYATVIFPTSKSRPEDLQHLLQQYPLARGARLLMVQGVLASEVTPFGWGYRVKWPPEEGDDLITILPRHDSLQEHWLIPGTGGGTNPQSPLMLWWALLFGLSLLARYQPAEWVSALDPDRSALAVPLEILLDEATKAIPHLVLEGLQAQDDELTNEAG